MIVRELKNVLFLDCETVPEYKSYLDMPTVLQELWAKKSQQLYDRGELKNPDPALSYPDKAALFPEFAKIVCVSFGVYKANTTDWKHDIVMKSFSGNDEVAILNEVARVIKNHFQQPIGYMCAYNGKGFDFPMLSKRMFLKNVPLPAQFITHNKKPWELTQFIDPCELWKFGSQGTTSLRYLAYTLLGYDAKELMDGSMVGSYVAQDKWREIEQYCESDVLNLAGIFCTMNERL